MWCPVASAREDIMAIEEITGVAELNRIILAEDRGVVIDFWGTWCQPCRALRPHLEKLAEDHAQTWRIVAVHAEENAELVDSYAVQSTPTIIYVNNGDEVHRSAGAVTPSTVSVAMSEHAG